MMRKRFRTISSSSQQSMPPSQEATPSQPSVPPSQEVTPSQPPELPSEQATMPSFGDDQSLNDNEIIGGSGLRKVRGGTRMTDVWNLKEDELIPVQFNGNGQPLGNEGGIFNKFTGCIARVANQIPLDAADWRKVPMSTKEDCWSLVTRRSESGKQNRSLQTAVHTAGSKSFARYAHELEKEKQIPIDRAELYKTVHIRSDGSPINPDAAEKIRRMEEIGLNDSGSSQSLGQFRVDGSIGWSPSDRYAQVIGPDRHGRVRGVGLGPTPKSHPDNANCIYSQPASTTNEREKHLENRVQSLESELASLKSTLQRITEVWDQRQNQSADNNIQVSPAIHGSSRASRKTFIDNANEAQSAGCAERAEGAED